MTPRQRLSHKLRDGKYRARLQGCPVDPSLTLHAAIDAGFLSENHCYYCGTGLQDEGYALEHKVPLADGGPHELANICKACFACNGAKHTMTEGEFREHVSAQATTGPERS